MNSRKIRRDALGLTQGDAARRAGVSFASWRRWEEDPTQVRAATRASCERVLEQETAFHDQRAVEASRFEQAWRDCSYLTPRQASAIALSLRWWADMGIGEWLRDPASEPLHEVSPFDEVDRRVMMHVNESRAWAAEARDRCEAVAAEIEKGVLPFDRPGCYFDELLMALALSDAERRMADDPELFEDIAVRTSTDREDGWTLDDQWAAVSDAFDDRCRWDEWEVPLYEGHPLLPAILAERHPYTWFDPGEGSGTGYLERLTTTLVEEPVD